MHESGFRDWAGVGLLNRRHFRNAILGVGDADPLAPQSAGAKVGQRLGFSLVHGVSLFDEQPECGVVPMYGHGAGQRFHIATIKVIYL